MAHDAVFQGMGRFTAVSPTAVRRLPDPVGACLGRARFNYREACWKALGMNLAEKAAELGLSSLVGDVVQNE